MPAPVCPISATTARLELEVDVVQHRPLRVVAERDVLEGDAARAGGSSRASGASRMSSGSSITWKMRSPEAVARCAWPIHMPSARSGSTSIARKRLNATKSPSESVPLRDHPPADEQDRGLREQRQEAEHRDVERALAVRLDAQREHLPRSARSNFACSASSCANDLTTWTPTMFSSATVATSAIFCCTSRSSGCDTWL